MRRSRRTSGGSESLDRPAAAASPAPLGAAPGRFYLRGMIEDVIYLIPMVGFFSLFVGAPVAILLWLKPRWRAVAFYLGLALAAVAYWAGSGPSGGWILLIELGLGTALAALLVEIPAFGLRTLRKRRAAAAAEAAER
jgi:hypothetical protein